MQCQGKIAKSQKQCRNKCKNKYCGIHIKRYSLKMTSVIYKEVLIKMLYIKWLFLSDLVLPVQHLFLQLFQITTQDYPITTWNKVYYIKIKNCKYKLLMQPL